MQETQNSKVLWQRRGSRWRIDLHEDTRPDGTTYYVAFVGGYLGDAEPIGLLRMRNMSIETFWALSEILHKVHAMLIEVNFEEIDNVPEYPECISKLVYRDEVFAVRHWLHRDKSSSRVSTLSLHDADDLSAPVLFALGANEIEELTNDFQEAQRQLAQLSRT